jgi:outer membrane murein-binding lipoprotein Lpp
MSENKEAYVEKLQAKMDEWNAEIKKLEAKARQAEADSKINYEKEVEELRAKRRDLEEKMSQVRESGEGAWKDLKTGIESAWQSLDTAIKSAASRFK